MLYRSIPLFIISVLSCGWLNAQTADAGIWKKQIARTIDTRTYLDAKGHVKQREHADTSLARYLLDAVIKQKITAYDPYNDTEKLGKGRIDELAGINGKKGLLQLDGKYRVLESWRFDPIKRTTEIQIEGIGVMEDIYGEEDSVYCGRRVILMLHWNDITPLLLRYKADQPKDDLLAYLWDDYFKYSNVTIDTQSEQSVTSGRWIRYALRNKLTILDTDYFQGSHFFYDNNRSSMFADIYTAMQQRRIFSYSDTGKRLTTKIQDNKIDIVARPDTVYVIDPVTNLEGPIIIHHDLDWDWFNKYTLLEQWTFDPVGGKTNINIVAIEPRVDEPTVSFVSCNRLRWFRYEDVSGILDYYYQHYPLDNLSTALWKSYFSEAEPQ